LKGQKMGQEVRRVPANWEHPENKALLSGSFEDEVEDWDVQKIVWEAGVYLNKRTGKLTKKDSSLESLSFEAWRCPRPKEEDYMPNWPISERTHYQLYENVTIIPGMGVPISPPMPTIDSLAHWLADDRVGKKSYNDWLGFICLNLFGEQIVKSR